jgi:hypothetical protein
MCVQPASGSTVSTACVSDLGAPVVLTVDSKDYVIGVVGVVASFCEIDPTVLFTLIYPYYEWIVTKLKAANAGQTW